MGKKNKKNKRVANNENELNQMISDGMDDVLHDLAEDLLKNYKSIIEEVVYGYSQGVYERTGEFLNAFEILDENSKEISIGYNPDLIHNNMGEPIGGYYYSPYHQSVTSGDSSADYLIDIIYQGNGGLWDMPPRDAGSEFEKWLSKQRMSKSFKRFMRRNGIDYIDGSDSGIVRVAKK